MSTSPSARIDHNESALLTPPAQSDSDAMPIPTPRSSLIGREQEIAAAHDILGQPEVRLLTLTGPGGVGKTRLALALASDPASSFSDGIRFVPLAAIRDPKLVPVEIAQAVGLRESGEQPLAAGLAMVLRDRNLLLILDNVEQVTTAAPLIADLLDRCPGLTILATSRASLHLAGERQFPVAPLALPPPYETLSCGQMEAYGAVRLFVARAGGEPQLHADRGERSGGR